MSLPILFEILCPYQILSQYIVCAAEPTTNEANNATCNSYVNTIIHGRYDWELDKPDKMIKFARLLIQLIAQTHTLRDHRSEGIELFEYLFEPLTELITKSSCWQQSQQHRSALAHIIFYSLLISKTQLGNSTTADSRLNKLYSTMSNMFILCAQHMVCSIYQSRELYFEIPKLLIALKDDIGVDAKILQCAHAPIKNITKVALFLEYTYTSIAVLINPKEMTKLFIDKHNNAYCPTKRSPEDYIIDIADTLHNYQIHAQQHKPYGLRYTQNELVWGILYGYMSDKSVLNYQVLTNRIAGMSQARCCAHLRAINEVLQRLVAISQQKAVAISEREAATRFIQAITPLIGAYLKGSSGRANTYIYELIYQTLKLDVPEITDTVLANIYGYQQINAMVHILSELISAHVHGQKSYQNNRHIQQLTTQLQNMSASDWDNARLLYPPENYQQTIFDVRIIEQLLPPSLSLFAVTQPSLKRSISAYFDSQSAKKQVMITNGGKENAQNTI